MRRWILRVLVGVGLFVLVDCAPKSEFPVLTGAYLGQKPPGDEPELFAPGIVSTGIATRDVAITPDGNEIYFCVSVGGFNYSTILVTRQVNGRWTEPEVAPFATHPDYLNFEPCISPDGQRFFFLSNRPDRVAGEVQPGDQDIWAMDRAEDGWGEPYNLGPPVNSDDEEYFPSVTQDGSIYFTRQERGSPIGTIYRSRFVDGRYTEPERLPEQVNSGRSQFNAFIAPDESYIIVPVLGRADSYGSVDYYIVFRDENDRWSEPVNMGAKVNTFRGGEYSPYVTRDGRYFFFMSTRTLPPEKQPEKLSWQFLMKAHNQPQNGNSDIYWVDAGFINALRP